MQRHIYLTTSILALGAGLIAVVLWLELAGMFDEGAKTDKVPVGAKPGIRAHAYGWTAAAIAFLLLSVLFPATAAQYHQLGAKMMHIDWIMAGWWALGLAGYVGICWLVPWKLARDFGNSMRTDVAVVHVAVALLVIIGVLTSICDSRAQKAEQDRLLNRIRLIVAEYAQEPGVTCTIGGPDGNVLTIGKKKGEK